jgi:hypothetical protein
MLAFVLDEKGPHMSPDQPEPEPGPDEVVVRVLRAGVCNTDLELARGYMDFNGVLGHEFVGQALDGPLAGKRVVAGINFGCGRCAWCKGGLERHCPSRRVMGILGADGAMAERVAVPSANLRVVPDGIDDDAAVFTEPVAAACEILDQLEAANGLRETRTPALVFGAGKLGPLIAQVLAAAGFDVGLVGRHLDSVEWLATLGSAPSGGRGDGKYRRLAGGGGCNQPSRHARSQDDCSGEASDRACTDRDRRDHAARFTLWSDGGRAGAVGLGRGCDSWSDRRKLRPPRGAERF